MEKIPDLLNSNTNFAYFVTFDDETALIGKEKLFIGGNILNFDGKEHFLCRSACPGFETFPVIISFDYVSEIFPDIPIKESDWPEVMMLIPEQGMEGRFTRTQSYDPVIPANENPDTDMIAAVRKAKERIVAGELLQVVLSREFIPEELSPMDSLRTYLRQDRSLYVYYFKFGEFEIFGSSPERLVRLEDGIVTTNPIAGTRGRGLDPQEDSMLESELSTNNKELCEHRMLVDLSRNDLVKVCIPESVDVTINQEIRKYRSVQHIVSEVKGKLNPGSCIDELIHGTFPAGTVSGAPKKRALQLISEMETTARGPYAGALGIIGRNSADLALTIRSCYGSRRNFVTRAGAGIVKDSVPEREVLEMLQKASTVVCL